MASAVDNRLPAARLSTVAAASRLPTADEATNTPALPPGTRPVPAHHGVGRRRRCYDDAEHGECGQDVANAAVVHGLSPFLACRFRCGARFPCPVDGRAASPVNMGPMPNCRQYRFLRIRIRESNRCDTEGRTAIGGGRTTIGDANAGCRWTRVQSLSPPPSTRCRARSGAGAITPGPACIVH